MNMRFNEIRVRNVNIGFSNDKPIFFNHFRTFEKSSKPELHLHEYFEINIYISGNADFVINSGSVKQLRGNILFTRPNELHCPVINDDTEYERYYIGIPCESFGFLNKMPGEPMECFFDCGRNKWLAVLEEEAFSELLGELRNIDACIDKKLPGYIIFSYFLRILFILGCAGTEKRTASIAACKPKIIDDILYYIGSNYASIMTVEEIAEHFYISRPYLSVLFSKNMNIGLKQYLQYTKIAGAKTMLADGKSVSYVSSACGFGSCSYFISVFKSVTGMTPNRYRDERKKHNSADILQIRKNYAD